jgi:hypothetical protein
MKINWSRLEVINEKREVKRYSNLHAMRSGLVLFMARYYERLENKKGVRR